MKFRNIALFGFTFALLSASLAAQGSGRPTSPNRPNNNNYVTSSSIKGIIDFIDSEERSIRVIDERTAKSWVFSPATSTKLKADKGLFESKNITWDQLAVGQRVKVKFSVFREQVSRIKEIKVIKPKKS